MKVSRITHWRQRLAHPRLTARLFPPPPPLSPGLSSQENEPEIVDLRDRAEQRKLCEGTEPFTVVSQEPWRWVILGLIIFAVFFVFLYIAL